MNKSIILFNLIWFVNSKKTFTAKEVSQEFNISVRTAHRYLTDLADMGIPIYSKQGRNGGYEVLDNQVYPPVSFTKDEVFSILFSFNYIGNYYYLPFDMSIDSVKEKIYSLLPKDTLHEFEGLSEILQVSEYGLKHDTPFLKELISAAINKETVFMTYNSMQSQSHKTIVPIGVYAYEGRWYSPVLDLELMEYRLLRVDRISDVEIGAKSNESTMTLTEWFNHYPVKNPLEINVTLNKTAYVKCKDIRFLQNNLLQINDDCYQLKKTIDLHEIPFYTKLLLSLGTNAEVLNPAELIDSLKKELSGVCQLYNMRVK